MLRSALAALLSLTIVVGGCATHTADASTTAAGTTPSVSTSASASRSAPTSTSGPAPSASAATSDGPLVVWTKDGRLVTTAGTPNARPSVELGRVAVGGDDATRYGPLGVRVSADRRTVYVWWRDGEPACGFHIGRVPIDGSMPIIEIGTGFDLAISPDGARLAWHHVSATCDTEALVVYDLTNATQRRIEIVSTVTGYRTGVGPFWQDDNRTLVYQPPTLRPLNRSFDSRSATGREPVVHLADTCVDANRHPEPPQPETGADVSFSAYPQPEAPSTARPAGC